MSTNEYALGKVTIVGRVDDAGECIYHARVGDLHTGEHAHMEDVWRDLAVLVSKDNTYNVPLSLMTAFDQDVEKVLSEATDEDFATAKAMLPLNAGAQGLDWRGAARAFDSRVGDAILALAGYPEELRDRYLGGSLVKVRGFISSDLSESSQIQVIRYAIDVIEGKEFLRQEKVYRYKVVRSVAFCAKNGQPSVALEALALVAEKDWSKKGMGDPSALPGRENRTKVLRSYQSAMDYFLDKAHEAWSRRTDKSSCDPAALLAYVTGMVRWMSRTKRDTLPGGLRNPWYALGVTLASMHGLDTSDAIFDYAQTDWDAMVGFDEDAMFDLDEGARETLSSTDGSVN